jgi:hypothetical protein
MNLVTFLRIFGLFILIGSLISSCNKGEIEDLEKRIEELEDQLSAKDSVLLSDLEISSQESMNIMAGRGITNILGTLYIRNCVDLTPLSGLRSLEGLVLEIPVGLTSLEGLNDLKGTNFLNLNFIGNANVDLSALDGLESVRNISLGGNIPTIPWFNEITTLESINIYASLPSLTFVGFENLQSANYINISNWQGNLEIQGFDNLKTVSDLSFDANMLTVSGFDNVKSVNYLNLFGSTLNFSGLNGISSLDYLYLEGETINISGLNGITSLNGLNFYVKDLDVSGLSSLESIKNLDVYVENTATGLNNLKSVNEYLSLNIRVYDNFLTGLTTVGIMNLYYYSYYNAPTSNIMSFEDFGFTSLQSIGGLSIDIQSLESLDGFDFSNSTLQEFNSYNCPNLNDISALSTYSGPIGYFNLNNTSLTSLDGLENVTDFEYYFSVTDNDLLEDWCAIKGIFDAIPSGQKYIQGNLVNPESADDITGCE